MASQPSRINCIRPPAGPKTPPNPASFEPIPTGDPAPYSSRSATIGSTDVARRAGT
jgi:hypothetical protein